MTRTRCTRGWILFGAITAGIGAASPGGDGAAVGLSSPQRAAVSVEPADAGTAPGLSGDGRFVVFVAAPPAGDGRASTVHLRDRQTGEVTELTARSPTAALGDSVAPVISADGCVVAVVTQIAYDVFRDDNQGSRWDVYRSVLPACGGAVGEWELVSTTGTGARGDVDPTDRPAISASGATIAYTHVDERVPQPPRDQLPITSIDVVDLTVPLGSAERVRPAAGMPVEAPRTTFRYRGQGQPALSADGRHLAFRSDTTAHEILPSWGSGPIEGQFAATQVFVWDREATIPDTAVRLVSGGASPADGSAGEPTISASGRWVAFSSTSTTLVAGAVMPACGTACPTQVYLLDRDVDGDGVLDEDPAPTGLTLLSGAAAGDDPAATLQLAGSGASAQPALSGDGSLVAFVSQAADLLPVRALGGGALGQGEVVIADVGTGQLRRASVASDGFTPVAALNARPQLSHTGRVVVFDSASPQLLGALPADGGALTRRIVAMTAEPSLSLGTLDVGTVAPGGAGREWYISVVNEGPSSFRPATITSSSPEFVVNGGTCAGGASVPPGEHCTVNVVFAPTLPGPREATLTVAEEGFGAISVTGQLRGSGGEPALQAAPDGMELADAVVGTPAPTMAVDIRNVGTAAAAIGPVAIGGSDPADFSVAGNGCARRTLAPGGSCTVQVGFTPLADGHRSATLTVSTTSGDQYTAVVLGGSGRYAPVLTVATPTVEAGGYLGVSGTGFPADAALTLGWADGAGHGATAVAAPDGTFSLQLPVPRGERSGVRSLVVTATGEAVTSTVTATVEVRILRADVHGPASASWPGR